jgi:hypothetical protein
MVALSPRFTFLAFLSTLAALSSIPISDAAALGLRALDPTPTEAEVVPNFLGTDRRTAPMNASRFPSRDAHRDAQAHDTPPVIPLPVSKFPGASEKGKTGSGDSSDSSGGEDDGENLSDDGPSREEDALSGDKKDAPHGNHGSVSEKDKKVKGKARITSATGNHPHSFGLEQGRRLYPLSGPNELQSDDKKPGGEHGVQSSDSHHPEVTIEFIDNRLHYVRAPHHHHHHHHHHHDRRRDLKIKRDEPELEHDHASSVISADNEHEVRPRAPHHHHDWHEKVVVSGDHNHVHARRSPHHHHHHHHHDNEKIIVSGDNDHVHVDRSVFIAGEQGQSYVVPHIAKRNVAQELFIVPSLRRRTSDLDGVPGRVDIMVRILVNRP